LEFSRVFLWGGFTLDFLIFRFYSSGHPGGEKVFFKVFSVDEPSRGGAPTGKWMVLVFGLKLFPETFSNSVVPTLYLLSKHTTMSEQEKELMRQFITKMTRDLEREEFIQNNPEFEIIETETTGIIVCKN